MDAGAGGRRDQRRSDRADDRDRQAAMIAEQGDDAKIEWVHRADRYHEKLATPDVTIADLIGEIDLVKHAEGRYLSDESTMHFGLIPRTNRGIFAINELPDLAPANPGGLVQRARRARRADSRLSDPAEPRRLPGLQRQSRGLHQSRPDRHAAEGPHRLGHSHALSGDGRGRDRRSPSRTRGWIDSDGASGSGVRGRRAAVHVGDRRGGRAARPLQPARQPGVGRVGAHEHRQPRDGHQQRRAARHPAPARSASSRGFAI